MICSRSMQEDCGSPLRSIRFPSLRPGKHPPNAPLTSMDVLRQLILSKWLYARGCDTIRGAGPVDPGLAVSLFQDAVELALAALAQHWGATLTKNHVGFFDWWKTLENAPQRGTAPVPSNAALRQLNDARISFKHYGRLPRRDEALGHQSSCQQFLVEVAAIIGQAFGALQLASLLPPGVIRDKLIEAGDLLESRNIKGAVERCADVQAAIDSLQEHLTRIPISVSFPANTPQEIKRYVDQNVGDLRWAVSRSIAIALSGHFGVNPIEFAVMREALPEKRGSSYGHSRPIEEVAPSIVRGWIDLQTNYALALTDAMTFLRQS